MKQVVWGIVIGLVAMSGVTIATNEDTQIIDALQENTKNAEEATLSFTTFESCQEMNIVLEEYIKDTFKNRRGGRGGLRYFAEPAIENAMIDAIADDSAELSISGAGMALKSEAEGSGVGGSSTTDFSTTNTQKEGIDEADILKSTGEYLYYYNQKEQKVHIIKSPLDIASSTIDLDRLDVVTNIVLPERFRGVQMYVDNDQLVIIANRWRDSWNGGFLNTGNQVDVIVYDVSTPATPELIRFTELDGNYHDSRRIGDKLYVVNQLWMDWYRPMQYWDSVDDVDLGDVDLLPKNIDVAYTTDDQKKNLSVDGKTYPYRVTKNSSDCDNIYYVLPTKESVDQYGLHPSFTVINVIDLAETEETPEITTAFGSTSVIHMSSDNLYLTNHFYVPGNSRSCPANARCLFPNFGGGEHTLVHKFNLATQGVVYQDSTLVNGSPITQYSMDQNDEGEFRILTSTRSPERATHFYVLDQDLSLQGSVPNIEPGEEFKSSRYIGDKVYLVTFESTDPLFVIDVADSKNPKIIGELVIPGFSTYLHPYAPADDGVQYLLGLGYDTDLNQRGGTVTEGVKLDLYKIDYANKDADGHVAVTQEFSEVRGERGSQTEALHNPRMFVWDEARQRLVLPLHLQKNVGGKERCQIELNDAGEETSRECREDGGRQETTFLGMKAIFVDPEQGIEEIHSYDYKELYKQDRDLYSNGRYNTRELIPRVGYVGDVLYQLNGAFGHFINLNTEQQAYMPFGDGIKRFDIGQQTAGFEITGATVAQCLADKGWMLYTSTDCRYCGDQEKVFGDAYEQVQNVDCDAEQEVCSKARITGYPSRTDEDGEIYPGVKQLEELVTLAGC